MSYLLVPLIVLGALIVLFGSVLVLGRLRGGRYLRPIVATLAKVGFMRRFFQKMSTAALERQNPELASALRKMQRLGPNPDPVKASQAVMHQLSPSERAAYLEAVEQQGGAPEPANRQQRRLQQRLQQGTRPAGGAKRQGKRRR